MSEAQTQLHMLCEPVLNFNQIIADIQITAIFVKLCYANGFT